MMKKTLFIVDDNNHICKIIACQFRRDFNCLCYDDVESAVAAINSGLKPSVIISETPLQAPEQIPVIVYAKPFDPEDIVFEVNQKVQ